MDTASKRLARLANHLPQNDQNANESLDDVVIVAALRTPVTKAKRGGLKDTGADDLLCVVLKALLDKTGVEGEAVGDIVVGSVLGPSSQRANECRIAALLAGIPETVPIRTVNRQCSSGLQAIADVAASIKSGYYNIGIGAGVETMTKNPMAWEGGVNPRIQTCPLAQGCMMPMGVTSDNVAKRFHVSREVQDQLAAESHDKALKARTAGYFKDEIVPVSTTWKDPKTGDVKQVVVDEDDGIRPGTTPQKLAKLPTVFSEDGTTTAGNSSQVSDGAAATLLMSRREANRRNLQVLGIWRSFAVVGVEPAVMGIGPAFAIPKAVQNAGLTLNDIDIFELNEAFGSQATYCVEHLGIDRSKLNPNGGAIALGHPLGCTGARMTATLLHEMKRRGRNCRYGVVSMCIGSGMGAAAVYERGPDDVITKAIGSQSLLSRDANVQ
eukprot:TRINITY_DN6399_c0_g1_i1.p1 TRINITY_DN6399_c0_g1~~TRINITY_DN6399_c0_g1_i1.p1  ORF type:complete len:439 (-),score=74.04 TRINITY_DN6399_c0_g1_i1:407-1723(-)